MCLFTLIGSHARENVSTEWIGGEEKNRENGTTDVVRVSYEETTLAYVQLYERKGIVF